MYLFREVRATPAVAESTAGPKRSGPPIHDADEDPERPAGPTVDVERAGSQASTRVGSNRVVFDRFNRDRGTIDAGRPELTDELPTGGSAARDSKPSEKLIEAMSEANKAYDRGDFDEAKGIAQKVLARNPGNVRMLRILVSASCIDGDNDTAQSSFLLLPVADREQMKQRCARYGVTFAEK